MKANDSAIVAKGEAGALFLGAAGVLGFSLTIPATKLAVAGFGGPVTGLGRPLLASILAGAILVVRREPVPHRKHWRGLAVVAGGGVLGFPLMTALALGHASSAHIAVIAGICPAATAGLAVLRAGDRPSRGYWLSMLLGLCGVAAFALSQGGGHLGAGDLLIFAGILMAALAYTEGALVAREIGGWRVISWALVFAAPVLAPLLGLALALTGQGFGAGASAWSGLVYVSAVSGLLALFAWYGGLAAGGVARVGQLQLAQPVLTLGWSALLLGEHVGWAAAGACSLIVVAVALGQRSEGSRPG